jgi:spore coat protein U-like protein
MTPVSRYRSTVRARGRWTASFGVLLVLTAVTAPAHAGADCAIGSASLSFGTYSPALVTPDDTAVTVTVTCRYVAPGTTSVNYRVSLSDGLNATSATARRMAAGPDLLAYNVYDDPARTRVWGSGSGGTTVASGSMTVGPGVGNGTRTATHVIYGRIPPLLDVEPGSYFDTLVLTLTY